jgi:hypothetical protein
MALRALLRIAHRLVIGADRVYVIRPMTIYAVGRKAGILIVRMTVFACHCPVCPRQRELRCVVIERRRRPDAGRVACFASVVETWYRVHRAYRPRIIGLMALIAIGIRELIITVDMARLTLGCCMLAGQREFRTAVIERRRKPSRRAVACFAAMIEHSRNMVRVCRALILGRMARIAVRVRQLKIVVRVTILALYRDVLACQRKFRRVVIKCRRPPGGSGVALHARLRISE